jgi:hypothetical protein
MRKWLMLASLFACLTPAMAQMRGGFGGGVHNIGGFAGSEGRQFGRGLVWYGDPFLYSDYSQPLVYPPPAQPVVIVQPSAAAVSAEPKADPLMIEWQGDHYVRYSGQGATAKGNGLPLDYSENPPATAGTQLPPTQQTSRVDLPPAVLVFRDGHREQVSDYVIANGNLYARGDYWHDGFWSKTVQLSALDMPATLRANSDSGVKFVLPSAPNEVVTRP